MPKPIIRITLIKREWVAWNGRTVAPSTVVREFNNEAAAQAWFIEDSYFAEGYTVRATWERLD